MKQLFNFPVKGFLCAVTFAIVLASPSQAQVTGGSNSNVVQSQSDAEIFGELARMYNGVNKIGADLHVIKMEGWKRSMFFDETGLEWMNPSPNIRSLG